MGLTGLKPGGPVKFRGLAKLRLCNVYKEYFNTEYILSANTQRKKHSV